VAVYKPPRPRSTLRRSTFDESDSPLALQEMICAAQFLMREGNLCWFCVEGAWRGGIRKGHSTWLFS
jgi:hypothetical protein